MMAGLNSLTFVEMVTRFPNEASAMSFLEAMRWPTGPVCSRCGCADASPVASKRARPIFYCAGCKKQFSVTTGTVMEDSKIPLHKWLLAIHLMCASKKGISSLQLHRMLGIAYRSAWHLSHRIRAAMTEAAPEIMSGTVEADEVYIGGLRRGKGRGYRGNKTAIVAIVERGGRAHAHVMPEAKVTSSTVADMLEEHVSSDAILNTDESSIHTWPGRGFASHDTVNHQEEEYVRRDRRTGRMASTNAVEGYFGNFRRQVDGTHHHVSCGHLPRYSNEFEFKYNTRKITDGERTAQTIRRLENRRLTLYKIAKHIPSLQDTRESR